MPSHAVGLSQLRSPAIVMHRVALDGHEIHGGHADSSLTCPATQSRPCARRLHLRKAGWTDPARCSMPPARAPCCVRGSGSTHCRAFNEAQAVRRFHRVLAAAYWDRIVAILLDQPTRSKNYDRRGTQRPDEIGTRSTVLPSRAAYEPWASVISLLPQARRGRTHPPKD